MMTKEEHDKKYPPSLCRKGFRVGSNTGANKCPKCEFKNSKAEKCVSSRACAGASATLNSFFAKHF